MTFSWTTALAGALGFIVSFVAVFWWRRRSRRDVWVTMHGACFFNQGDVVSLGTDKPVRQFRVLAVTRYAVKVRPL